MNKRPTFKPYKELIKSVLLRYFDGDNSVAPLLNNPKNAPYIALWRARWLAAGKRFNTMKNYKRAYDFYCAAFKCSEFLTLYDLKKKLK